MNQEFAYSAIFEELKTRIVEMELKPGTMINEKELIKSYGVSRTPVREALIMLSQYGLIEMKPKVGTFVAQIDLRSARGAYEVKKVLEGLAAELAAVRATEQEISELFQIFNRLSDQTAKFDYQANFRERLLFHQMVHRASHNEMLIEMLNVLNTKTARLFQSIHGAVSEFDGFDDHLRNIAEAIKDRKPESARYYSQLHSQQFLDQMSKRLFSI